MFLHSSPSLPGSIAMAPSLSHISAPEKRNHPQPHPPPPSTRQEYLAQVCFMRQRQLLHARMLQQQQQQQEQQRQCRRSFSNVRSSTFPPLRPHSRPRPYQNPPHHSRPIHQPALQRLQDDLCRLRLVQSETATATTMRDEHSAPWSPTFVGSELEYQQRDPSLGKALDHSGPMVDPRPPISPLSSPKHTPNNGLFSHALPSCSPNPNLYSKQTRSLSVVDSPHVVSFNSRTLSPSMEATPLPSPELGPGIDRHDYQCNCTHHNPSLTANNDSAPHGSCSESTHRPNDHPILSKHLQTQAWVRALPQAADLENPQ